jgi:hypothetical protein
MVVTLQKINVKHLSYLPDLKTATNKKIISQSNLSIAKSRKKSL